MNERIRKLAADAGYPDYMTYGQDLVLERFAELIVQECVDICDKIYFENYPDAEDFERSEEGDAIKQRFGVEE